MLSPPAACYCFILLSKRTRAALALTATSLEADAIHVRPFTATLAAAVQPGEAKSELRGERLVGALGCSSGAPELPAIFAAVAVRRGRARGAHEHDDQAEPA